MASLKHYLQPNPAFVKQLTFLALPIALQYLIISLLNILDVVLIEGLGDNAIAAVSLANQVNFVTTMLGFGVSSAAGAFISQYIGAGSSEGVRKTTALSFLTIGSAAVLVAAVTLSFPKMMMHIFTSDETLVQLGSRYLPIVAPTYLMTGVTTLLSTLLRCTGRPKLPLVASLVALSCNSLLNYLLIYGIGIFPRLEIAGAAVATLISRCIEIMMILLFVYRVCQKQYRPHLRDVRALDRAFAGHFYRKAVPVILNETVWGVGMAGYNMIYGRMGAAVVAAVNIASTLEQLFTVAFQGLSNATLVILGRELGAGSFSRAKLHARQICLWIWIIGALVGLGMWSLSGIFVGTLFRNVTPETAALARYVITVLAIYAPFKAFNFINIVGVLRSGGDTFFGFMLDTTSIYCVGLPLCFLFGIVLKLPLYVVSPCVYLEEALKSIFGLRRMLTDRWARKFVKEGAYAD
ncbi:MAG: MATE family efflux transporter [Clostridia bacterium]|nr:MATE family efflux transporter [Clostridia bacterium]